MEKIIEVTKINKSFKINKRMNGLPGHIANLFMPKYEIKQAVNEIDFEIYEGECVGFIGSNGAGKSTTIKMLSGILYPDSGNINIMGYIPYKERKKYVANIGVVFGQKSQLAWDLPVIDSFELLKHIYAINDDVYEENLKNFIELLDMNSFINQPVRQLSLGQRMRADIAAALLHSPKLVFFDEPTIGLDVVAKERIREFVRYMNKEKKITFIFTTHDMQDIAKTCNRIILIDKGKKVYDGSVSNLIDVYGGITKLSIEFDDTIVEHSFLRNVNEYLISELLEKKIELTKTSDSIVEFKFDNKLLSSFELVSILAKKYNIKDFKVTDMDIEEIVRKIYEGGIAIE